MHTKINFKGKIFFGIFLWAGLLFADLSVMAQTPYNVVINMYGDPKTQMAFNWFTTSNTTGEQVQIVQGTTTNFTSATTVNATTNQNVHKAVVSGLSSGTTYSFRVGKANLWSGIGTFTTAKANKDSYSFIYLTDNAHWNNESTIYNLLETNANAVSTKFPNAKFWLFCGDFVHFGTVQAQWNNVIQKQQNCFYRYPFAPVIGNHENFNSGYNYNPTNYGFKRHFNLNNQSFDDQGSTYSFVYGDAQFFAINSERWLNDSYTIVDAAYITNLSNWMRNAISARPDIKWRIVYFHKSTYSANQQGSVDAKIWRQAITPLFDELNMDIAFFGHDHVYQVIGPVYNKQLVPCSVSNVQQVTPNDGNVTGKSGGIFDVSKGTLYFNNSHFGDNSGGSMSLNSMPGSQSGDIPLYSTLFTGRLGKSVNSTYSNVSVSTDNIVITTYQINNGASVLFDEIKIVKENGNIITTSQTWNTNRTVSDNIVVPSGVTLTITATAYFSTYTIKVKCGGHLIVSGGTIDDGNVIVQNGGKLTLSNNGKIVLGSLDNLDVQLGAELDMNYGEVLLK